MLKLVTEVLVASLLVLVAAEVIHRLLYALVAAGAVAAIAAFLVSKLKSKVGKEPR